MSFEILDLHIADDSPEALAVERIMLAKHVSAEEAIRTILRDASERNIIREGRGMFRDPEDSKILDEAVAIALDDRRRPSTTSLD